MPTHKINSLIIFDETYQIANDRTLIKVNLVSIQDIIINQWKYVIYMESCFSWW